MRVCNQFSGAMNYFNYKKVDLDMLNTIRNDLAGILSVSLCFRLTENISYGPKKFTEFNI